MISDVVEVTAASGGFELASVKTLAVVVVDVNNEPPPVAGGGVDIRRLDNVESSFTTTPEFAVMSSMLAFRERVGVEPVDEVNEDDGRPMANNGVNSLFFFFLDTTEGGGGRDDES